MSIRTFERDAVLSFFFSWEQRSNKFSQMFYSSCGGECPSTANFCHQCGQQLKLSQDQDWRGDVVYADHDSEQKKTSLKTTTNYQLY